MAALAERFAGPRGDIPRPSLVEIPPALEREIPIHVAVISDGVIAPNGNSSDKAWEAYKAGKSGIVEHLYPPYTDKEDARGQKIDPQMTVITAGTIKNFDPIERLVKSGILPRKEIVFKLDPYAHYALAAGFEALSKIKTHDGTPLLIPRINEDGTPNKERKWIINSNLINPLHAAVVVGSGFGGGDVSAEVMELLKEGKVPSGDHMMRSLLDRAASSVTQAFGINGGAEGVVAACASSGKAMLTALRKIAMGEVDLVLVIGTEGILGKPVASSEFNWLGALDIGQDPRKVSRSLHKIRRGFTIAEGAVALVVANIDWARRHSISIPYEIIGYGETSGAGDNVAPNGVAQEQTMRLARRRAEKFGPIEGKIINSGHYTGTPLGEASEVLHTQNVLEDVKDRTVITASKRLNGHMLGAAGNLSQWFSGKALQEGIVPGTPFDGEKMDELYGWDVPEETRPEPELTHAITNQFGFGDANVTLWSRKSA